MFCAMFICLVLALSSVAVTEQIGTSQLSDNGAVNLTMYDQAGGNMEGKRIPFWYCNFRNMGYLYNRCF
ncbi:MAG: hypothetical protein ACLTE2_13200 [Eubacteriales bacterium]